MFDDLYIYSMFQFYSIRSNVSFYYVYITQNFYAGGKYVIIHDNNGFAEGETCETRGYESIRTKRECDEAAKGIPKLKDYVIHPDEVPCGKLPNWNPPVDVPNHCWLTSLPPLIEGVAFTQANCPIHKDRLPPIVELLCRKKQEKFMI